MPPDSPRPTRTAKPGGYAFPPVPMDAIYLDYNGSAPLDPRVAEFMARALTEGLGNASSVAASAFCHGEAAPFAERLPFTLTELGTEPRAPERAAVG